MQNLRRKLDRIRRELDDVVVALAAKAHANDHHPNFHIKDSADKAAEFVQKSNNELFMAQVAIGDYQ